MELHFTNFSHPLRLHYAGLHPAVYPASAKGSFDSSDKLHNKIYDLSVHTLQLCMHEHYEDSPWREQSLYALDAMIQMLCGYYAFGEYDFPRESLRLLGKGIRKDKFLELCAPAEVPITIPVFSMAWITAVRDHWLYSGQTVIIEEFLKQIKQMLKKYISMKGDNGLLTAFPEAKYWNFYEWSKGLDDNGPFNQTVTGQ